MGLLSLASFWVFNKCLQGKSNMIRKGLIYSCTSNLAPEYFVRSICQCHSSFMLLPSPTCIDVQIEAIHVTLHVNVPLTLVLHFIHVSTVTNLHVWTNESYSRDAPCQYAPDFSVVAYPYSYRYVTFYVNNV